VWDLPLNQWEAFAAYADEWVKSRKEAAKK
jgi:hypothetical protein